LMISGQERGDNYLQIFFVDPHTHYGQPWMEAIRTFYAQPSLAFAF